MELKVLNSDFIPIKVLDTFDSLIWTDRYCGFGDFEYITSDIYNTLYKIAGGVYVALDESEHKMVIEDIKITSDPEKGDILKIGGRSLESILDRRIVWNKMVLSGGFQKAVEAIVKFNAISCTNPDRDISRLFFEDSTDPAITSLTIEDQFYGVYVYDAVLSSCLSKNVGFKITLDNSRNLIFKLYSGVDRSYDQFENPFVIFSEEFDNLLSSEYKDTSVPIKTVALVAGEEGVGNVRRTIEVPVTGGGTDLDRREVFVDASNITRNVDGVVLTDAEYDEQLSQKGYEELIIRSMNQVFEANIDPTRTYIYGTHFFIGDILQIADSYGHQKKTQVREVIHFQDASGSSIYPTFTSIE